MTPNSEPIKIHGRVLEPGQTEISITGERGRFTFFGIYPGDGSVMCYGGQPGREKWRSFHPDRVKTIHRKILNRKNQETH